MGNFTVRLPPIVALQDLIVRRLMRSRSLRDLGSMVGATAVGQIIAVAASPILTRMYTPADFGLYQTYLSFIGFGLVIVCLRYEIAIPIASNSRRAAHVLAIAIAVASAVTGIALLLGLSGTAMGMVGWNLPRLNSGDWLLQPWRYLLALCFAGSIFAGGVAQALSYWGVRERDFKAVAHGKLNQAVVQTVAMLTIGAWKATALSLVVADLIGRTSSAAWLSHRFFRPVTLLIRGIRGRHIVGASRRFRDFPLISAPSSLINTAGVVITPLLVFHFYGASAAGSFALVDRVSNAPGALIGTALSQIYVADLAGLRIASPHDRLRSLKKMLLVQTGLGVVPFGMLFAAGPYIFPLVFGQQWREAGDYARVLAALNLISFISMPLNLTLAVMERQRWQFAWDFGRLVLVIGVWGAAGVFGLDSHTALTVYASLGSLTYIGFVWLCWAALAEA